MALYKADFHAAGVDSAARTLVRGEATAGLEGSRCAGEVVADRLLRDDPVPLRLLPATAARQPAAGERDCAA